VDSDILVRSISEISPAEDEMPDELSELQERAESGSHEHNLAPVTVTMSILAVLVAAVSLLGHRAHTEEIVLQTKATDQWAFFQAKDIRRRNYEILLDELSIFTVQNGEQADKAREKYSKQVERYTEEQKDIQADAKKEEAEVVTEQHRADRFDLGEVLLEAGLVICSITLLTRKRLFWYMGTILGALGVVAASAAFFIH
jgi:hypothetical protein